MDLVAVWRWIVPPGIRCWVVFRHGTCVILPAPEADLAAQARGLMRQFGTVRVGGAAGDFATHALEADRGWIVTGRRDEIATYVGPDEVKETGPGLVNVGLIGRNRRHLDSQELDVVHVEDGRAAQADAQS